MEFMGMELIDTVQKGELFALLSPLGGFYHAERIPGRSSIWEFSDQGTETSVNAESVVELLKSACGNYAGFRSHHAEGKVLQACRDKNMYLRFNNYNFDKWEQWSICGNSLDRCLLVNRKFPDKQFEASLHKVLIITELSLHTLLKRLNVKVKNEIMQRFGENAEEVEAKIQLHNFPSEVQNSTSCTDRDASLRSGSKLYEILDDFFTSIATEAENKTQILQTMLIEKQALEYESKLNSVQGKVQDLEMRLLHVQESTVTYRKKSDDKIALLLNDLEQAQMDSKCAAADQLKLKLIQADSMQLSGELHSVKSCVNEMELKNKLAEEKVQKFVSQARKSHERVCELEMLLDAAQVNIQTAEEKLLLLKESHTEEVKALGSKEEGLKEALKKADKELDLTRKRVFELEHELRSAPTREEEHLRQTRLKRELTSQSIERSVELQNAAENINEKEQSNIFLKSNRNAVATVGTDGDNRLKECEIERAKFKRTHIKAQKTIRELEAQLKDAKLLIEKHEKRSEELNEKEIHDGSRILELGKKLEVSDIELKSNRELAMTLQLELHELQLGRNTMADTLKEAEVKAAELRLAFGDQESVFSLKCQELEDAVICLSGKLVKLEDAYKMVQSEILLAKDKMKVLEIDKVKLENIIIELEEEIKIAKHDSVNVLASNEFMMRRHSELQGLLEQKEAEKEESARQIIELEANLSQARHEIFSLELVLKSAEEKCSKMECTVQKISKRLPEVNKEKVKQDEERSGQIENKSKQSDEKSAELEEALQTDIEVKFLNESGHALTLATSKMPAGLETKLQDMETSLLYHEKAIKQSVDRSEELEGLIKASHTEAKHATQKASSMEALLVVTEQNYKQSETKVKLLTKEQTLLDGELQRVKAEADIAAARLEEAEKRISEILPSIGRLTETEILVSRLKEKISMAEGRARRAESDLHESTIKMSTLRRELSTNQEMVKNLQASLSEVEDHKLTLGAQIENVTRSFSELNKQLKHERQHLQVQIASMRQANETVNGENARLQGRLQGSLSDAKACGKKLEESLLWRAVPEKEMHNLKSQKSKTKPNISDFFENIKERGLSVNLASGKSPRQKHMDAAGEVQVSSASRHKVNGSISDFQCSPNRSWMLLCLFAVLCTCFAIKFWLIR